MSEENAPKLRLKPKLATPPPAPVLSALPPAPAPEEIQWVPPTPVPLPVAEVAPAPAAPVFPVTPESLVPPATTEAPKFVRLKPRLSVVPPAQPTEAAPEPEAPTPSPTISLRPAVVAAPEPTPSSVDVEAETAEQALYKFAMPAPGASASAAPAPSAPPPVSIEEPPSPADPVPVANVSSGETEAPRVEPLAMPVRPSPAQAASDAIPTGAPGEGEPPLLAPATALFPPPSAKFPRMPEIGELRPKPKKSGAKAIIVFLVTLLLVGGGGYYAYDYLTHVPPPPEPVRRPAKPATIQGAAVAKATALGEQTAKAAAVIDDIIGTATQSKPAAPKPDPVPAKGPSVTVSAPSSASSGAVVAPVEAPGVPVASLAFRAWVENLRVGGVRAAAQKVFIGGTSYSVGDLVNPQLGITFEGYNATKRTLVFKDRTGATLEKRD